MGRKKKVVEEKTLKARTQFRKVYVSGLNWSKLSSVYIGEINNTNVVARLANIPYFSSLYGMELCGFSINPNELPENVDSYVQLSSTEPLVDDALYFPVYNYRKKYSPTNNNRKIREQISDLSIFNVDEHVVLNLKASNISMLSGDCIEISSKNEITDQEYSNVNRIFSVDGNKKAILLNSGNFKISALLNGSNCISDWINIEEKYSNLSIDSFSFLPIKLNKNADLDSIALSNRMMAGYSYRFNTNNDDLFDGNVGNFRLLSLATDIFVNKAINQPNYVIKTDSKLGGPIFKNYFVQRYTKTAFEISSNYDLGNNVQLSGGGLLNIYDGIIKPSKTGWYKFFVNCDDNGIVAIDDKIVWCGNYAHLSSSNIFRKALSSSIINSNNDRFSLSSIISSNMCNGNELNSDEANFVDYYSIIIDGQETIIPYNVDFDYTLVLENDFSYFYSSALSNANTTAIENSFQIHEYKDSHGNRVFMLDNLKDSQYVFLLKDHKYLIRFLILDSNKSSGNRYFYGLFNHAHFVVDDSLIYDNYELSLHNSSATDFIHPTYYENRDLYVTRPNTYKILSSFSINNTSTANMLNLKIVYGSDILSSRNYGNSSVIPNNISSMLSNVLLSTDLETFNNYAWANVYKPWSRLQLNVGDAARIPFVLNNNFYTEDDMLSIMNNYSNNCYKLNNINGSLPSEDFYFNFMPCQLKGPISWT